MRNSRSVNFKRLTQVAMLSSMMLFGASSIQAQEKSKGEIIHDKMTHSRAVEAVVWAMPLLNFNQYRKGNEAIGVNLYDIGYYSKIQDWKFQTATPNNTTPMINFFWNIEDGPIVVEMPPASKNVKIFGTLMDAWQRPIDDVGAKGRDQGRGGKYLLVPAGYDGPGLENAYTYEQRTNYGFAILRPILPNASQASIDEAAELAKKIKVYPLSQSKNPPANKSVDMYGKLMEGTPVLDETIYAELNEIIQEEVIDEKNLSMMGLLNRIGIQKGKPFAPDAEMKAIYAAAAPEALEYMIYLYHRVINPWMYDGTKWSKLVPPGAIETDFTYEFLNYNDYLGRGASYYAIISSVKNYGTATFYMDLAETAEGDWLEGANNYKLVVPADVPVSDFWAVNVYDLETASYIRDMPKSSVDSDQKALKKNKDGSVDIFFGPKAPKGKESNWIPTNAERRFFLLFRCYGPQPGLFDGSFSLNNIELVK